MTGEVTVTVSYEVDHERQEPPRELTHVDDVLIEVEYEFLVV